MEEIAVDLMLIQIGAQYVNALKEGMVKGQLIAKLKFDVLNFQIKQRKNSTNFCPRILR